MHESRSKDFVSIVFAGHVCGELTLRYTLGRPSRCTKVVVKISSLLCSLDMFVVCRNRKCNYNNRQCISVGITFSVVKVVYSL